MIPGEGKWLSWISRGVVHFDGWSMLCHVLTLTCTLLCAICRLCVLDTHMHGYKVCMRPEIGLICHLPFLSPNSFIAMCFKLLLSQRSIVRVCTTHYPPRTTHIRTGSGRTGQGCARRVHLLDNDVDKAPSWRHRPHSGSPLRTDNETILLGVAKLYC